MSVVLATITAAVTAYVLIYYAVFRGARCRNTARLDGKTAVVTGELQHCKLTSLIHYTKCSVADRLLSLL